MNYGIKNVYIKILRDRYSIKIRKLTELCCDVMLIPPNKEWEFYYWI